MLVYRFEEEYTRKYRDNITGEDRETTVNHGIFSSDHITYTEDSNYQSYGCTLWKYKESNYRFACRSIDKLIEYFGNDFANLIGQDDVILVEYEVKRKDCFFSTKRIELVFEADKVINRRVVK